MKNGWAGLFGVLAVATVFVASGAPICWAQIGGPALTGNGIGPIVNPAGEAQGTQKQAAPQALPPALPGAKSDPSQVAAPTKAPTDMNPTDALFDAINRGDIGAARDAINRGADLGGHNVLGMTPMELSVDLSRNDISFLLLSMRGADSGSQAPAPKDAKALLTAKPVREVRAKVSAPAKVAPPPPPRVAKLFAGDGGAPVPASGFLGFGGTGNN
jgi:hypothetical protein